MIRESSHNAPLAGRTLGPLRGRIGRVQRSHAPANALGRGLWLVYRHRSFGRTTTLWYRETVSAADFKRIKRTLAGATGTLIHKFAIAPRYESSSGESAFRAAFDQVKRYIDSGDCYQVNLARYDRAHLLGDHATASWIRIAVWSPLNRDRSAPIWQRPTAPLCACHTERFIKFSDQRIETAPIKGTAPRHLDPNRDAVARDGLACNAKDRAENLMIVDLLRNDLGRLCVPGTIETTPLFTIETFANVHHLVSAIPVPCSGVDAWMALEATFTGGSVTGAPKIHAMEVINEMEPVGRSV